MHGSLDPRIISENRRRYGCMVEKWLLKDSKVHTEALVSSLMIFKKTNLDLASGSRVARANCDEPAAIRSCSDVENESLTKAIYSV